MSPDGTFVRMVAGAPTTIRGFKAGRQTFSLELTATEGASFSGDGVGYVGMGDGRVVAFDPVGGTILGSASLPAAASGVTPAIRPDGTLCAGTVDGRVVQIR